VSARSRALASALVLCCSGAGLAAPSGPLKVTRDYAVPAVQLVRDDGSQVSLPAELDDGRPVVMNFIFTSCGSICPVMSSIFGRFQKLLGADAEKVHLVSISIDPEQDTPERLTTYSKRYHAAAGWTFYTGSQEASVTAQKAFGVYRGSKMNHTPVTLLRLAPGKPWLRVEGFMKPEELVQLFRDLQGAEEWKQLR
jgi:protein SCO1